MKTLTIDRPFELKSLKDDGTFTGYASVYGELDSHHDIVIKGAFDNSLQNRYRAKNRSKVPMLWYHDPKNVVGGFPVKEIKEDDYGFLVGGSINLDVQRGREGYSLLKREEVSGMSIGYNTISEDWSHDGQVRILKEVDLWEISLVTFPSGDSARVTSVKSIEEIQTIRDAETYLREAGHSKSDAEHYIARMKAILKQGEPADEEASRIKRMHEMIREL